MAIIINAFERLLKAVDPEIKLSLNDVNAEAILKTLELLTKQEQEVLIARFGLGDKPPMKLAEVKFLVHTGVERVRQIQARALRKLRQPTLKPLLTDPISPKDCVQQLVTVEWVKHPKSLTWYEIKEFAEKLGVHGWQLPSVHELRAAIRDKIPGFTSLGSIKGFWSHAESGGPNTTYVVRSRGTVGLADKKSKQYACLVRTLCKNGLITT